MTTMPTVKHDSGIGVGDSYVTVHATHLACLGRHPGCAGNELVVSVSPNRSPATPLRHQDVIRSCA